MFNKVLVANRGEIAVRIIRACREMGIRTVAIYSEADRDSLHTLLADEAVCIGPASAAESYLDVERIIAATVAMKADAVHPGYGFLSEKPRFAELCERCSIRFIGPGSETLTRVGNKPATRKTMLDAGIPVIPGSEKAVSAAAEALEIARVIGFPVMIKAAWGGEGKGIRLSKSEKDFSDKFAQAQKEAVEAFFDDAMFVEKYIEKPRHIEVQLLADTSGNVIHLGERDCSIQLRQQKVLEEAPCEGLSAQLRKKMSETAVKAAKAAGYVNAGTVEFLLDKAGKFYFMEMNPRIQSEHPITEAVTGLDLVKEQVKIAFGEPLSLKQENVCINGHSIECRVNAESEGSITNLHLPGGMGVRVDTAIYNDLTVKSHYDSLLLKLIVHDRDRASAIAKLRSALGELVIEGVETNLEFLYDILNNDLYQRGEITTDFIAENFPKHCK